MRSVLIATSVALALGSIPAVAQITSRVSTANTVTAGSAPTVTSSNTSTASGNTSTTTGSFTSSSAATEGVTTGPSTSSTAGVNTSSTPSGGSSSAFGTNTTTAVPTNSQPSFGPGGSFSNDSGNTALGTSTGQTSSGTAAGNSSSGLGAGSATLDPNTVGTLGNGPAVTNADGTVLGSAGVNVVGERVPAPANGAAAPSPSFSIVNPPSSTPIFDQAARDGRAKEQQRKARGQEPRVYGIAPRTENDLTWQMPDDKIIRY